MDTTPAIDRTTLTERLAARSPYRLWIECGDGWLDLIDRLDRDLAEIDPDYRVAQVKEKFGGLRFYFDSDLEDRTALTARIAEAEAESFRTCEITGNPGVLTANDGWYAVRDMADPVATGRRLARSPRARHRLFAISASTAEPAEDRLVQLAALAEQLLDRVEQLEETVDRCREALDTHQEPASS